MASDNQGNVVAAGVTENVDTFLDFTVAKFDPDGALLWQQNISGTGKVDDGAFSVSVDNQGCVVAAGYTRNTGTFRDFTIVKFDPDGALLWQQVLNGTANWDDEALSVAVDDQGDVIAAGFNGMPGRDRTSRS